MSVKVHAIESGLFAGLKVMTDDAIPPGAIGIISGGKMHVFRIDGVADSVELVAVHDVELQVESR